MYNLFKLQNSSKGEKYRYMIFRIKGEEIALDCREAFSDSNKGEDGWNEFVGKLADDLTDGAYGLFDFNAETADGRMLQKIVFVSFADDDSCNIKKKMLYGSTRQSFVGALSGLSHMIQANSIADLEYAQVTDDLLKGK